MKRVGPAVFASAVSRVVTIVTQLALVPLLTNAWGVERYGIWAMLTAVPFLLLMSDFSVTTTSWARMTRFVARGRMQRARIAFATAWATLATATAFVAALAALAVWGFAGDLFEPTTVLPLDELQWATFALVLFGLVMLLFRQALINYRAKGEVARAVWANIVAYVAEYAALFAVVLADGGILIAALAMLAMRCLSLLFALVAGARRHSDLRPGFAGASLPELRRMGGPALYATLLGAGLILFQQGSVLALGAAAGAAAVPAFVAVRTLSRLALQGVGIVSQPLSHAFGDALALGQWERAGRLFGTVLALGIVGGSAVAAGLLVLGRWFVDRWTLGALEAPFGLILAMALAAFLGTLWTPFVEFMLVAHRQRGPALANLVSAPLAIGLIVLLAPTVGSAAAGWGLVLVDGIAVLAVTRMVASGWWREPRFRSGVRQGVAELRRPWRMFDANRA